jgi:hypothetical protein
LNILLLKLHLLHFQPGLFYLRLSPRQSLLQLLYFSTFPTSSAFEWGFQPFPARGEQEGLVEVCIGGIYQHLAVLLFIVILEGFNELVEHFALVGLPLFVFQNAQI